MVENRFWSKICSGGPKISQNMDIEIHILGVQILCDRATHPYLGCTVHFIDRSWELQSLCIEIVPLFEDHTGENVTESLLDIMTNWNLSPDQLILATTDNGASFVAGFCDCGWMHLSCFGHNLDLAIHKGLNMPQHHAQIEKALSRCRSQVAAFNRSWKKNRDLREKQAQLGLAEHKLVEAVATRWGSTNGETNH